MGNTSREKHGKYKQLHMTIMRKTPRIITGSGGGPARGGETGCDVVNLEGRDPGGIDGDGGGFVRGGEEPDIETRHSSLLMRIALWVLGGDWRVDGL